MSEREQLPNLVEMLDDDPDSGFNQSCAFGHLVAGHAVYCHNTSWNRAPRKCRRTWYTDGRERDEDCEGFRPRTPPEPTPDPQPARVGREP